MKLLKASIPLVLILLLICIPFLIFADNSKTISVEKNEFYEGDKIRVNYTGAEDKDWLGIYPKGGLPGAKDDSGNIIGSLRWGYLYDIDGVFVFMDDIDPTSKTEPLPPGEYDLYYLKNDAYEIADKIEITILEGSNPTKPKPPLELTYDITAKTKGYAEGKVTLKKPSEGPEPHEYILYWANTTGKLKEHSPIATVKASGDVTEYTMIDSLFIPQGTTKIIAYSKSGNTISDEWAEAKIDKEAVLGTDGKLYSFNVITDIHIGASYDTHLERALKSIFRKDPNSVGIFTVGDNTENGYESQYKKLMDIVNLNLENKDIKMYFTLGNHDMIGDFDEQVELFKKYTGMKGVYHHTVINDTYFIHLGNEDKDSWTNPVLISENQMKWLENLLNEASSKKGPVFVFLHQPLYDTVAGSLPGQNWDGVKDHKALRALLDKYPNVLLFTGHTHWKFDSRTTMLNGKGKTANYFNTSAIAYLWTDEDKHYDGSQGYFVEVYKDYVLVRGYDFELEEWSSCAQFMLRIESASETEISPKTTESPEAKDGKKSPIIPIAIGASLVVIVLVVVLLKRKN